MRKNMKKKVATVLSLVFVMTSFVGCGNGTSDGNSGGELTEASYEVDASVPAYTLDTSEDNVLTWYVNADWFGTSYGEDIITQTISEELNLEIEFIIGDDTNLNTYYASGDLPDIITVFDSTTEIAINADSWAYSLNELADAYDPYFYEVADEQTLDWYSLEDGLTYGYPSYSNSQDDYDSGLLPGQDAFIIRQDVYEAIGEPSMKTEEEFLEALALINEMFPELTTLGFRPLDSAGSTGSIGNILQDYLGVPIVTEDGEFYNRNLDEEYLSWIKVFNEAYNLGYISQDGFSDSSTIFEEKVSTGEYACMMISSVINLGNSLTKNMAEDSSKQYIAIEGPTSEVYDGPTINQTGLSGWSITYVTDSCDNPEKAIQLFTYLLSDEGQYLTTYGIEGVTYEFNEDGKAVLLEEVELLSVENPDLFKEQYRLGEFWFFGHDTFAAEVGLGQTTESTKDIIAWATEYLEPQFLIENIDPEDGSTEAKNLVNIDTTWGTTLATLIQADSDEEFDAAIESYETFLENNGYDEIVEIRNANISENAEKLGITEFTE